MESSLPALRPICFDNQPATLQIEIVHGERAQFPGPKSGRKSDLIQDPAIGWRHVQNPLDFRRSHRPSLRHWRCDHSLESGERIGVEVFHINAPVEEADQGLGVVHSRLGCPSIFNILLHTGVEVSQSALHVAKTPEVQANSPLGQNDDS